ncbi:MAG: FlgD immunoglobulin-like domain containing protein, partial [Candidatus Zixiibacteriota bacterium]
FTPVSERAPYCVGDTDKICISGIYATDTEGDPLTIAQICGPGALTLTGGDSAVICFTPTSVDSVSEFCVQVSDGCHSQTKTFFVTVFPSPSCGSSARVAIVGPGSTFTFPDTLAPGPAAAPECVLVGGEAAVEIIAETFDRVGGYDMLISYDASAVAFLFADPGAGIGDWEFFTFNSGPSSSCGVACPNGLLRLVAIADANDGASHPPNSAFSPQGVIARVSFLVSQNQLLGSQFVPVRFFWVDCGDNSFSDPDGEVLYLDSRVFSADGSLIWNEDDDTKFPSASRPPGLGADDACLVGGSGTRPVRGVDYFQGGICIVHPDSINDRGDLNLNGISYEIADAVTYTNYFIIGLRAFKINLAAQVAASDVNADGATLTIADLVFLIRVLTGDENPIPKIVPSGAGATVYLERDTAGYSITSEAQMNIGAAVFTFEFDGPPPESVTLAGGLAGMDLRYSIEDGRIRALVYERAESAYGAFIPAGKTQLMSISLPDDYVGEVRLINAELSDQQGWAVVTPRIETNILPKSFELAQNYPNPFNPSTRIKLSLPQASRWSLTVYNVLGRQVRRYVGQDDAGVVDIVWDGRDESGSHVASGIYLYQAKAGSFRSTRKMLLLK